MALKQLLPNLLVLGLVALDAANAAYRNRTAKLLFHIVRFNNEECSAETSSRNGTCLSQHECFIEGGTNSGVCAAGFGVCCVFDNSLCGDQIRRNGSYVTNPAFPGPHREAGRCSFTILKAKQDSEICSLRLDFESFLLRGSTDSTEADGGACSTDAFSVTPAAGVPIICGQNSGQHIYVDFDSDEIVLDFSLVGDAIRRWSLRATQLECNSALRPPSGCVQFHRSLSGRITTFNFSPDGDTTHLADQQYSVCIARTEGYCCVVYEVCRDIPDAFTIHNGGAVAQSVTGNSCIEDSIQIEGSSNFCSENVNAPSSFTNKYCGRFLNAFSNRAENSHICDCSPPFAVSFSTNSGQASVQANTRDRGVCLDFYHRPCQ